MLWVLTATAATPQLFAWVTESDGSHQVALILELGAGAHFDPRHTYTIDLERDARPAGRVQCGVLPSKVLRCRIEGVGEQCPTCATVLDLEPGVETSVTGVRAFAGRRTTTGPRDVLVFEIDALRFGPTGLITATAAIETVTWDAPRLTP